MFVYLVMLIVKCTGSGSFLDDSAIGFDGLSLDNFN